MLTDLSKQLGIKLAKRDAPGASDGLTPDAIVAVARQIASGEGFSAVSTRRIAQQFGVTATALYYHFANKQALLDRLAETLMNEVDPPTHDLPWQQQLRGFVLAVQTKMFAFPGLNSHLVRYTASPGALRWTDTIMTILMKAGFDGEPLWRAFAMLIFFVNPRTLMEKLPNETELHSQTLLRQSLLDGPERYPALAHAVAIEHRIRFDSYYEIALDGIIAGLESELQMFLELGTTSSRKRTSKRGS
jgi:AcrR family transcriptional regulator